MNKMISLEDWLILCFELPMRLTTLRRSMGWKIGFAPKDEQKRRFAGRLAHSGDCRWTKQVADWIPNYGMGRDRQRPKTRWSDQLEKFAGGNWASVAKDPAHWATLEEGFVSRCG